MAISRRKLLALASGWPYMSLLTTSSSTNTSLISAINVGDKFYIRKIINNAYIDIPINFEPHSIIEHTAQQLIVIGKRPSDLLAFIDTQARRVTRYFQLPHGRHFWGHGRFESNDNTLYTTEYDFENEISQISQWSMNTMQEVRIFNSHGIGGHDLLVNSKEIICANGGFKTSPEFHRKPLNIKNKINATLSIIDKTNAELIASIPSPHPFMSYRHLCQSKDTIYVGLQNKTTTNNFNQPLIVALNTSDHSITTIASAPPGIQGYITSIKTNDQGLAVATSHINDTVYLIDTNSNTLVKTIHIKRPQGIGYFDKNTVVTTAKGYLVIGDNFELKQHIQTGSNQWTNHCSIT